MAVNYCRVCHNTSFHFSREHGAVICDICDTPIETMFTPSDELNYQRNRQKAIAYIKANDYQSATSNLSAMKSMKPDDPDIYYLHLIGLTDCLHDLLLNPSDNNRLSQCQNHWQTLCRLNGDKQAFLAYGHRRRYEAIKAAQEKQKRTRSELAWCIGGIVACLLPLLLTWLIPDLWLFLFVAAIPVVILYKNQLLEKHEAVSKALKQYAAERQPFFNIVQ